MLILIFVFVFFLPTAPIKPVIWFIYFQTLASRRVNDKSSYVDVVEISDNSGHGHVIEISDNSSCNSNRRKKR